MGVCLIFFTKQPQSMGVKHMVAKFFRVMFE